MEYKQFPTLQPFNFLYLLGYDIGSSSVKAALVRTGTRQVVATAQNPATETGMVAQKTDWAEQNPELWWKSICLATQKLLKESGVNPASVMAIGISYQMHGLVLIDKEQQVLRPSIIWCDSRAVEIGRKAFPSIGKEKCLKRQFVNRNNLSYPEMEKSAALVPIGANGLSALPFGNGAERMLENKAVGAQWCNLNFNTNILKKQCSKPKSSNLTPNLPIPQLTKRRIINGMNF